MSEPAIQRDQAGAVATLWLNRPEVHNAFDERLIESLTNALRYADADPDVRVVVLGGRGKSFCAGGDLEWMRRMASFNEAENLRDAAALAEMYRTLAQLSKPTIARVHGAALGGGTGLVAACDMAIATPKATFGTTEVRLGLIPATISPYVLAAIGTRAARRYFLSGERFDSYTALRLGLVSEVCAEDALDARLGELTGMLLAGGPSAQAASKRLVADFGDRMIDAALIADSSARIARARGGAEAREGIKAFFEKRSPSWKT